MAIQTFATAAEQTEALAAAITRDLYAALAHRQLAFLAVSGGRSPIPLFERLSNTDLPWDRVWITLVDERCVGTDHPDSNAALVQRHLLQHRAAAAHFQPWLRQTPAALDGEQAQTLVNQVEAGLGNWPWPLDVAILGMGDDGHTASWFPDSVGLDTALSAPGPLAWVQPRHAPHWRLTLTLPTLLSASRLHLSIAGAHKRQVLAQAQSALRPDLPVSHVLHQDSTPIDIWICE